MTREVASSVRLLLAQLARMGIRDVRPDQVERWYLAGLIPAPERMYLGYGRGTTSRFPRGTAPQVRELHTILERDRSLNRAAIRLFLNEYPVDEKALQKALRAQLAHALGKLERIARSDASPEQKADDAAQHLLRGWVRTKPERHWQRAISERLGSPTEAHYYARSILLPFYGGLDEEGLREALARLGLPASALLVLMPTVAEMAQAGQLSIPHVLDRAVSRLTVAHFKLLAQFLGAVLHWLEVVRNVEIAAGNSFLADCLDALRRPPWRHKRGYWKPVEIPQPTEEARP